MSKRGGACILHYVKSAYAVMDVPDEVCVFPVSYLPESQRYRPSGPRSHLAAPALAERLVLRSDPFHRQVRVHIPLVALIMRKFWIDVEMVYQTFNLMFSWFTLVSSPSCAKDRRMTRGCTGQLLYCICMCASAMYHRPDNASYQSILSNALEAPSFHVWG
jgi:hypothetical protein